MKIKPYVYDFIIVCSILGIGYITLFAVSCKKDAQKLATDLPQMVLTDAVQNAEISELKKQVRELKETVQALTEESKRIDSTRIKNYIDSRYKSVFQHYSELSKRYANTKPNR